MKRRILLMAAGIAVALMSAAAPSALAAPAPHVAAAPAAHPAAVPAAHGPSYDTTICAHTNTAYCADVVGDSNTVGARIWLYQNGADDHWDVVPAPQGCEWGALNCYWIEDAEDTGLCLSATGNDGAAIKLERCGDQGGWNDAGDYELYNGDYGESGELDAQAIGTHNYLYALSGVDGGKYNQFTVYGWN
jgi:hypothetical protein